MVTCFATVGGRLAAAAAEWAVRAEGRVRSIMCLAS